MSVSYQTDDLRISGTQEVIPPQQLHDELPLTQTASETTHRCRQAIHKMLHGEDDRLLVITGPCSIHDPQAARDYAKRLLPLRQKYAGELEIVMRVYFEKPRTTVGWKGLINDPDLDDTFDINKGLHLARDLLRDVNDMGMPAGTEYLDLISPQYIADLISWGAIGARTTESQGHRELSSGLSCAVGFKNGTTGNVKIAVDAIGAAQHPHHFMSLTKSGHSAIFKTTGNNDCHLILRGGKEPNYSEDSVDAAVQVLQAAKVNHRVMIDFSHANSRKQHERQKLVAEDVGAQIAAGSDNIFGIMVESHLVAGRQNVVAGEELTYGQSITDACIGWDDTEQVLAILAESVEKRRRVRAA